VRDAALRRLVGGLRDLYGIGRVDGRSCCIGGLLLSDRPDYVTVLDPDSELQVSFAISLVGRLVVQLAAYCGEHLSFRVDAHKGQAVLVDLTSRDSEGRMSFTYLTVSAIQRSDPSGSSARAVEAFRTAVSQLDAAIRALCLSFGVPSSELRTSALLPNLIAFFDRVCPGGASSPGVLVSPQAHAAAPAAAAAAAPPAAVGFAARLWWNPFADTTPASLPRTAYQDEDSPLPLEQGKRGSAVRAS
jgi:hypothetical protein